MTTAHDPWHLPHRQTQIIAALTTLVQRGQLQPAQLHEVEALYASGLLFEAERVAGLAIWLATSPPQAQLQALPERLGMVVQAWQALGTMLRTIDQWEMWWPYADTLAAFQRDCLRVSPSFYTRLLELAGAQAQPLPTTLTERGHTLQRLLTALTTGDPLGHLPAATMDAEADQVFLLEDLTHSVQQIVDTLLWLGQTLRVIRRWELWTDQASSYAAFLDDILGLGPQVGTGLVGFAAAWETTQHHTSTLGTLETAVQVLTGHTIPTIQKQRGSSR